MRWDKPSQGPPPPRLPAPPHLRRFPWLRLHNDFPTHAKWRAVARGAEVPVHEVVAVVTAMLCKANVGVPRGSLAEFSVAECAAGLDLPDRHVARIYAVLEELHWIDQGHLTTWDERQVDKDDATAADRMKRMRERRREMRVQQEPSKEALRLRAYRAKKRTERTVRTPGVRPFVHPYASENQPSDQEVAPTCVTQRNVTPREEESQNLSSVAPKTVSSGDRSMQAPEYAALSWLGREGKAIVAERLAQTDKQAEVRIARWLSELDGYATGLAEILRGADRADYIGARFHNMVVDGIRRARKPPQLPLPPVSVSRKKEVS